MERIKALIPSRAKIPASPLVDSHHCHFYFLPFPITRLAGIYLFKDWSKISFHLFLARLSTRVKSFRGLEFRPVLVWWSETICPSEPQWSPSIVLILCAAHPRADVWHLQHEEAPRTFPPCPSGSCLLLSWITTTTTMGISQNGWAATGDTEQKSDQTESENAVSGDLQKPIMTEGLHSQQWWEPAFGERECNRNKLLTTLQKQPTRLNLLNMMQSGQLIYYLCDLL